MPQSPIKDLGPCKVYFDSTLVGESHGSVIFRTEDIGKEVFEDAQGETPVDEVLTGAAPTEVEVPLTRNTLAELNTVLANSDLTGTTLTVSNPVGYSLREIAKELVIKPIIDSAVSADASTFLTVFVAAPKLSAEITYDNEGQRIFTVTFKAFPNDASGVEGQMWKIG